MISAIEVRRSINKHQRWLILKNIGHKNICTERAINRPQDTPKPVGSSQGDNPLIAKGNNSKLTDSKSVTNIKMCYQTTMLERFVGLIAKQRYLFTFYRFK